MDSALGSLASLSVDRFNLQSASCGDVAVYVYPHAPRCFVGFFKCTRTSGRRKSTTCTKEADYVDYDRSL